MSPEHTPHCPILGKLPNLLIILVDSLKAIIHIHEKHAIFSFWNLAYLTQVTKEEKESDFS